MFLSGSLSWYSYLINYFSLFRFLSIIGSVLGLILSFVTIFKQVWASKTAHLYAI